MPRGKTQVKQGENGNSCFIREKRITCRNRNCKKRFTVKIGYKNNGYNIVVECPNCGMPNVFKFKARSVD